MPCNPPQLLSQYSSQTYLYQLFARHYVKVIRSKALLAVLKELSIFTDTSEISRPPVQLCAKPETVANAVSIPTYFPALYRHHMPDRCRTSHASVTHLHWLISFQVDKASWWGCGQHISNVMDSIPEDKWCDCKPKVKRNGIQYPPMATKADWLPAWLCSALVGSSAKEVPKDEM